MKRTLSPRWIGIVVAVTLMTLLLGTAVLAQDESSTDADEGALIISVVPGGPAAEAGLVRGDIILAFGEEPVESSADLSAKVWDASPGDVVTLTILHGDDQFTVDVELADQAGRAYLGVYLARDIDPQQESAPPAWGAPWTYGMMPYTYTAAGAMVVRVAEESPAEEAGIAVGDVILGVGEERLAEADELAERVGEFEPGAEISLELLRRSGALETVTVVLAEHPEDAAKAYLGIQYLPTPRRMFLGHTEEGDLLVPPMPEFRHPPHFRGPQAWPPRVPQPRNHRWLPHGYPMPHDCDDDMHWWGCQEDDDTDESEEPSDKSSDEGTPGSSGNSHALTPGLRIL